MEENEIIKSMKAEMQQNETEFKQVINELNVLEQNYIARKTQLEERKEQLRGSYTTLYMQLQKFGQVESNEVTDKSQEQQDTNKNVKPQTKNKKTTTKSTNKKEQKQSTDKVSAGLTPDEIAKINKAVPNKDAIDNNGNEIPDYLQSEYNK